VPCPCTSARQKLAPKAARAKYRDIFRKGEDIFKPIANRKCQQSSSLGILVPLSSKVNPFLLLDLGNLHGGCFQFVPKPKELRLAYPFALGIFARKISRVYHQYLCFPLESRQENPRQPKRKCGFNRSTCIWDKVDWRFAIFNRRHHHWDRALPHRPKPGAGARKVY
jgi:hypothetical protein